MKITLENIIPYPLATTKYGTGSVWGNFIELNQGQQIILNASSGKGKSTFTTTLMGIRNDYEGSILYDGINIKTFTSTDWSKIRSSKMAAVYQDLQLFPQLTVKENLLLKNRLTDRYTETELIQHVEKLKIDTKWNHQCGKLSMGQQQRVAIIRAIAQPYDWLIMDEPFSHLDLENKTNCMDLIHNNTIEQGAGFILTTLDNNHTHNYDQELKL
ncbi:MAG: ATP-binding cassette domain-containing protein [Crocinitomicaceae bacterium]|nr:ATP-binding cassette domain-containing protein [Crocinitomicaceae bacterium]MDG1776854.1 ATP-binding cassette domain-containing protein [Crocinitomicaceae bacterium]